MISSMTGFGKGTFQSDNTLIEVEVKSVNSRYLEISLRLPKNLLNKEFEIREFIRERVKRGKIILSVQVKKNGIDAEKPVLNLENLNYTLNFIEQIRKAAKTKESVKLQHLLSFQDLFFAEPGDNVDGDYNLVKQALSTALDEMIIMRRKEGEELAKDIVMRINSIKNSVEQIEKYSKESSLEYFEKLKERTKQIFENIAEYSDRMELELALLVDKSDVTEECVRLKSHLKFFLENLDSGNEIGRKLNFLCQEINREANTIGSKTLSTEISHLTVQIKEELERIREQIQNIE